MLSYIGSFNSEVDGDLRKLKDLTNKDEFIRKIDSIIEKNEGHLFQCYLFNLVK